MAKIPVRYIRDWVNGNEYDGSNDWLEIQVYDGAGNVAAGKTVTGSIAPTSGTLSLVTDGDFSAANNVVTLGTTGPQWVQVDLGSVHNDLLNVRIWHKRRTGPASLWYIDAKTQVSADGINWATIYDATVNGGYNERDDGYMIPIPEVTGGRIPIRYIRDNGTGQDVDQIMRWCEIKAMVGGTNIAAGKPVTASHTTDNPTNLVTDNYTGWDSACSTIGGVGQSQNITIDLGQVRTDIEDVIVWRKGPGTYRYISTEVSEDGVYWRAIWNWAWDGEYPEAVGGKTIPVPDDGTGGLHLQPPALGISDKTANSVSIIIAGVEGGETYELQRSERADFLTFVSVYTGPAGIYVDQPLVAGKAYFYRAQSLATDTRLASGFSNVLAVTVLSGKGTNKYRTWVTDPINGRVEYFPLGEAGLGWDFDLQDQYRHQYQEKLNGTHVFVNQDYARLKSLETMPGQMYACTPLLIEWEEKQGIEWVVIKSASFKLQSGKWYPSRCQVQITPEVISPEDRIKGAPEVNLFKLIPVESRVTVSTENKYGEGLDQNSYVAERLDYEKTQNTPITGDPWHGPPGKETDPIYATAAGAGYAQEYQEDITDRGPRIRAYDSFFDKWYWACKNQDTPTYKQYTNWVRYVKWIPIASPLPPGTIDLNETSGGNKKIAKIPQMSAWETQADGIWKDECGYHKVQVRFTLDEPISSGNPLPKYVIDNGLLLGDILAVLVGDYGVTVSSRFFNINSEFASDQDINYVTNDRTTTGNVVVFQKSDVKRWDNAPGDNATVFKTTAKSFIESICMQFNCVWGVIDGVLVIEHVSFFKKNGLWDLTEDPYARFVKDLDSYTYISQTFPAKENFTFMERSQEIEGYNDFNGLPITYANACTTGENTDKDNNVAVDKVTNDIGALAAAGTQEVVTGQQSGEFSNEGMVFASCTYFPEGLPTFDNDNNPITCYYFVNTRPPILDITPRINNVFGWAWLHNDFYGYDRFFPRGSMNNAQRQFVSIKPQKESDDLVFTYCGDFDNINPNTLIKTASGWGFIKSGSVSLMARVLKMKIAYLKMNDEPPSGIIYVRFSTVNQSPTVLTGTCPAEPDVTRELQRSEDVTIIVEYFDDPFAIAPHARSIGEDLWFNIARRSQQDMDPVIESVVSVNPAVGSSVATLENMRVLTEIWTCSTMTGSRDVVTFRPGNNPTLVLI